MAESHGGSTSGFVIEYEDLDSEFDPSERTKRRVWRDDPLTGAKLQSRHSASVPSKQLLVGERDQEEWRTRRFHLLSMDAYSRHKTLINHYLLATGRGIEHFSRPTTHDRNDYDILKEQHKFLWEESEKADSWEKRLSKAYYDKLFKEYAISDLSKYKENRVAMRWRTESEVVEGKGQFVCGSKHCSVRDGLQSWEVNFSYVEQDQKRNALVKLRLCPKCSHKLNYHHKRKLWERSSGKKKRVQESTAGKKRKHMYKKGRGEKSKRNQSSSSSSSECDGKVMVMPACARLETCGISDKINSLLSHSCTVKTDAFQSLMAFTQLCLLYSLFTKLLAGHCDLSVLLCICLAADSQGDRDNNDPQDSSALWTKSAKELVERSKEEEYDDYFKDMLM